MKKTDTLARARSESQAQSAKTLPAPGPAATRAKTAPVSPLSLPSAIALNKPASMDARMVRSRAALRQALLLLLMQKPFDQITVRDIVKVANIGYATFFRHYQTKMAMLEEIVAEEVGQIIVLSLPPLQTSGTYESSLAVFAYVNERRDLWKALLTGGAAGLVREEFAKLALHLVYPQLDGRSWLPAELGIVFGSSATVEIIAWWLKQDQPLPIEDMAKILDRLVVGSSLSIDIS